MLKELTKGIIKENPLFVQLLGVCPSLATTGSLTNALGMGAAFTMVLIGSNLIISAIKSFIPEQVRIPSYIVVIASLVTVIEMLMEAFVPDIYAALGIFIPLIVVNCIILGRAEAFASKHGLWSSLQDAVGMGIGFTLALAIIATFRELLGTGKLLGIPVFGSGYQPILILILPAGAFITMGFVFAAVNYLRQRNEVRHG
ncbi:MAG: electron transport complex subunit E [Acidaminococcaceae bacterium]|nr:electron transport complex subunit E [Acidaminococcaceae bacterium]